MVRFRRFFFFKVPKSTKFSIPQKKTGQLQGSRASADRKHHPKPKNRQKLPRGNLNISKEVKKAYKMISFVHFTV